MPEPPKSGEKKSDFMKRCIPVYINEGYPDKQAAAMCFSMWRKKHPGAKSENIEEEMTTLNNIDFSKLSLTLEEAARGMSAISKLFNKSERHIHLDLRGNIKVVHKSDSRKIIAGYASLAVIDTENEYIPVEVLKDGLATLMDDESYANIMIVHKNIQIGKILERFDNLTTHVDDKGLFIVAEIRDDLEIAKATWEKIEDGEIRGFSIGGEIIEDHKECDDKGCIKVIDKINLFEISVCSCPVNKDSGFEIVNKSYVNKMLENCDDIMKKKKTEPKVLEVEEEPCKDCEEEVEEVVEEKSDDEEEETPEEEEKAEEEPEPVKEEEKAEDEPEPIEDILTKSDIIETIKETITETLKSLHEKELQEDEEDEEEEPMEDEEEEEVPEEEKKKSNDEVVEETSEELEMAVKARDEAIEGLNNEIKALKEQVKNLEETEEEPKTSTEPVKEYKQDVGIIIDKRHGKIYKE